MIVGAGFAGLIAAHVFPREIILESAREPLQAHRALLRFRTDEVGKLTGIEFRKVRVRKGIFVSGIFTEPNISLANAYARKCLGRLVGERSIWNIDPVDRFVAPESFYEQLLEALGSRIHWATPVDFKGTLEVGKPVISTAPLPVVMSHLGWPAPDGVSFDRAPITVARYRIPNCDTHQTVYFPTEEHSLYRASITGDLLICEFAGDPEGEWTRDVFRAFSLAGSITELDSAKQSYGKIAPVDNVVRKELIHKLSVEANIFSIGRFATWRNILLDDVVNDAAVIKKLLVANSYERRMAALA